MLTQVSWNS